jgi:hypothetical protein
MCIDKLAPNCGCHLFSVGKFHHVLNKTGSRQNNVIVKKEKLRRSGRSQLDPGVIASRITWVVTQREIFEGHLLLTLKKSLKNLLCFVQAAVINENDLKVGRSLIQYRRKEVRELLVLFVGENDHRDFNVLDRVL